MNRFFFLILISTLLFCSVQLVGAVEKEERKWQDETIYYLMVDRFNNGDSKNDFYVDAQESEAYHGGDFEGIIEQLDYIKNMGFTAISLSPIFDNGDNGYHGYWTHDFYKTEEHFGSIKTFKKLVKEVHKRDMKIILDFVANHVGQDHPWVENPEKSDWFHEKKAIVDENNQEELENGWVNGLPDLAQENVEVRDVLIDAAKWWIEETDIDGYRLKDVNYIPVSFWKVFSKEVKGVKDGFYLLGDAPSNDPVKLGEYTQSGIDGFVDYPYQEYLRSAFAKPDQPLEPVYTFWDKNISIYENPYLMGTIMDNDETVRFTRDAITSNEHPGPRWRLALTYLYTTPGVPIVYYGSEIALDGGEAPDNHRQMDLRTDKELIEYITKIGELRQKLPSLTRGTFEILFEEKGMLVFKRVYEGETSVITLNNTSKSQTVKLTSELVANKELRGLLGNDLVRDVDGEYNIIIDRDEAEIYVLAEKTDLNVKYIITMIGIIVGFLIFILLLLKRSKRSYTEV